MKLLRVIYRVIALPLLSLVGLLAMAIFSRQKEGEATSPRVKKIRQWWLKKVVSIVGLSVVEKGEAPKEGQAALWVSNHISWLDIPLIGSEGVAFLAKSEIRKWPVIGWLGEKSGSVFIRRGGTDAAKVAGQKIADKIRGGDSVLVFPEGTTSDGEDVKRFHARIFAPAIDHQLMVQPVAIRYLDPDGSRHPKLVWKDEPFLSNVFKILGETNIIAEVSFLPILNGADFSQRKQLSELAYNEVRNQVIGQDVTNNLGKKQEEQAGV